MEIRARTGYRHVAYALSIIILLNKFLSLIAEYFLFSDTYKVLWFGCLGITALLLGVFKFHKGLSFGLSLGGISAASFMIYYYRVVFTDYLRFSILMVILVIVCFALYLLYKKEYQLKKG